ncbi:MAG: NAD(P) transhydrogenase subunit alpha [Candidatus Nanopelagicales bacterium]|nr:NAD(P) transhydrogenase subunit alpha [Candidatus Nanopelagicales bacterium]MDZ4250186.1 NAD(P) transhydrogenase subunit alpha [Candidatus Nanopelagicales bacterium]
MRLFVPAETRDGERRVAVVADVVGKLSQLGLDVDVQTGAGSAALASDDAYREAGATVIADADVQSAFSQADIVATVRPLPAAQASLVKSGAVCLSLLQPGQDTETIEALAKRGATAMSFDLIPRISRAQSMDALTSQALVTGYRATLVGAELLPKFFPLFMTAAGTIPPAKVLVLGAGVAGLQAIATAKRLGAKVSAYDVRPASADEVKSMGGTFINLDLETAAGTGGYAKEMSQDRAARQQELLTPYVAGSDVVITTAAVPGRRAPLLLTEQMVATMRPGSVVIDLASESGGNVAGSKPGETTDIGGVRVWGAKDVASDMPAHASRMYAMNVLAVLELIVSEGALNLDPEDEVVAGSAVVLEGEVENPVAREALGLPEKPPAEDAAPGVGGN